MLKLLRGLRDTRSFQYGDFIATSSYNTFVTRLLSQLEGKILLHSSNSSHKLDPGERKIIFGIFQIEKTFFEVKRSLARLLLEVAFSWLLQFFFVWSEIRAR